MRECWNILKLIDFFSNIRYKGITSGTRVQLYQMLRILTQMRYQSGQVLVLAKDVEIQRAHGSLEDTASSVLSRVANKYIHSGNMSSRFSFIRAQPTTKSIMQ